MGLVEKKYKQTELGLIPNDWEIKEFQDIMTGFFSGATPYRGHPEYYKGEINWITSGELNYNIITDTLEKITEQAVKNTNLKILPKGTFLFAITGLEAEGTRGSCGVTGVEATTNQSCMALFPKEALDSNYLYNFYVWQGKMLAFKYCQGTKQQSYTAKIARTLPIILPPTKSEQTAIAIALTDVDALIETLEKTLEKKRNIVKGVLSELLRPKANWRVKELGEIGKCYRGVAYNPNKDLYQYDTENSVRLLRANNINENVIKQENLQYVDNNRVKEVQYLVPKDIVICMANGSKPLVGKAAIFYRNDSYKYTFGAFMGAFRILDINSNADFVFYNFQTNSYRNSIDILLSGSSINNLKPSDIESLEMHFPSKEEQNKIAKVLNDFYVEIRAVQGEIDKYKMIKQGMMQTLLTGKIRLI